MIPGIGIFAKIKGAITMAKNTSILLGEYFENFINEQVKSGRFSSASEVVRTALRMFEQEENKTKILVSELKAGEKSGMIANFDRKKALSNLHTKHLQNEI
jgi:antitoxin ParD1/3/4